MRLSAAKFNNDVLSGKTESLSIESGPVSKAEIYAIVFIQSLPVRLKKQRQK